MHWCRRWQTFGPWRRQKGRRVWVLALLVLCEEHVSWWGPPRPAGRRAACMEHQCGSVLGLQLCSCSPSALSQAMCMQDITRQSGSRPQCGCAGKTGAAEAGRHSTMRCSAVPMPNCLSSLASVSRQNDTPQELHSCLTRILYVQESYMFNINTLNRGAAVVNSPRLWCVCVSPDRQKAGQLPSTRHHECRQPCQVGRLGEPHQLQGGGGIKHA